MPDTTDCKIGQLIEAVSSMQDDVRDMSKVIQGNAIIATELKVQVEALEGSTQQVQTQVANFTSLENKGKGMFIILIFLGGAGTWLYDRLSG